MSSGNVICFKGLKIVFIYLYIYIYILYKLYFFVLLETNVSQMWFYGLVLAPLMLKLIVV